jgi:PBP1b-binding outer membrane lipoprotein LpoB
MKNLALLSLIILFVSGCAATWSGVKEDTASATDWTKKKVNDSASFVKEKTE